MFRADFARYYYEDFSKLPHTSKYHFESYYEHVMLVVAEAQRLAQGRPEDDVVVLAACLHDINKPLTQGFNKVGGACFYGHELVRDADISVFLSKEDRRYERAMALIRCHMFPYNVAREHPDDLEAAIKVACRKELRRAGLEVQVDDEFYRQLMLLHKADDRGSVRSQEALEGIDERVHIGEKVLADME
mgnify:CR=1 FL=1